VQCQPLRLDARGDDEIRVHLLVVWRIWKSDLSSTASDWRIDRHATASWCETTRRDGDVRYARRTGYGQLGEIMYVPPRYRHTDKSVHTAPLYAIYRRWKINYSIFVRADDNNDRSPNYWKTNITGFLQYAIKIRPIIFIICNQKVTGDLIMSFHGDISNKPDKII